MAEPRSALGSDPFARKAAAAAPQDKAKPVPKVKRGPAPKKKAAEPAVQDVVGEIADVNHAALAVPEAPALPEVPPPPTPPAENTPVTGLRGWLMNTRMRGVADEVDAFGMDPMYQAQARPVLDFLFRRYWRVKMTGVENIPAEGRAMLVGNHSGGLPYDAMMLMHGVQQLSANGRTPRPLVEDAYWHLPFMGVYLSRLGAVRAHPDNAERLLRAEQLLAVFPEGTKGMGKPWKERYKLQRFGRGGFVKLALKTGAPILPVAVVGAEELHPMLGRVEIPGTGLPFLPITPTFPWLGALGVLPLPTRWTVRIGPPIHLKVKDPAALTAAQVNELVEQVRSEIQRMVDDGIAARGGVVLG
jgi:1-acyl-sn-glycerol-3-phosphate acyltransferase